MFDPQSLITHLQSLNSSVYTVQLENELFTSNRTKKMITLPVVTLTLTSTYNRHHTDLQGVLAKIYPDQTIWIRDNLFPKYNQAVAKFIQLSSKYLH